MLVGLRATGMAVTCPSPPACGPIRGAAPERAWLLVAAAVGALVEAGGGETATAGEWDGRLVLVARRAPTAELAALAFEEQVAGVDRLRAAAVAHPGAGRARTDVPPAPPTRCSRVAARGRAPRRAPRRPAAPSRSCAARRARPRPTTTPIPSLRAARRILQRLRGMGKWGGYHTEFAHLAKGFPGNERALASTVGEALLAAGLLAEKPSVGQRHVFLDPRRAADIHALDRPRRARPACA